MIPRVKVYAASQWFLHIGAKSLAIWPILIWSREDENKHYTITNVYSHIVDRLNEPLFFALHAQSRTTKHYKN